MEEEGEDNHKEGPIQAWIQAKLIEKIWPYQRPPQAECSVIRFGEYGLFYFGGRKEGRKERGREGK